MKYQRTLENIRAGLMTRAELRVVRENAMARQKDGDADAHVILQAIDSAVAQDESMIFMGFCPNAEIANRLDTAWKAQGICTFDFDESTTQMNTFRNICSGDLVILKKVEKFGKTMRLFGHGRVNATKEGADGRRYLVMDWSTQDRDIEVPLMGCQSTVNLRTMESVEAEMPPEFFVWLEEASAQPREGLGQRGEDPKTT